MVSRMTGIFAGGRIFFQVVEDLPAIRFRHEDIEQDGLWLLLAGHAQTILSVARRR